MADQFIRGELYPFTSSRLFEGQLSLGSTTYDLQPVILSNTQNTKGSSPRDPQPLGIYAIIYPNTETNRTSVGKAFYAGRIKNLYDAIDRMGEYDEDEPFHITEEAAKNAHYALSLFVANDLPPPSIFPNASDALVFKWDSTDAQSYAYLDEGIMTFKIYAPVSQTPLSIDVKLADKDSLSNLIGYVRSSTQPKILPSIR